MGCRAVEMRDLAPLGVEMEQQPGLWPGHCGNRGPLHGLVCSKEPGDLGLRGLQATLRPPSPPFQPLGPPGRVSDPAVAGPHPHPHTQSSVIVQAGQGLLCAACTQAPTGPSRSTPGAAGKGSQPLKWGAGAAGIRILGPSSDSQGLPAPSHCGSQPSRGPEYKSSGDVLP